ncbi:short-chain dehydrogenase [Candidatus Woesearchaeota archaeon]|jgi:retinol dehydrogenase-8|nr:short-chain dehydrogenase [Candidatus Woesearchaeota archaeon]|tara:strand:- start:7111 stop:7944 length:834 start_codon:yes stop_codon:yes gene_type:complete
MSKVVLITGCSSGIGLATAVYLAKQGNKVYASLKDLSRKDKLVAEAEKENVTIEMLQLDVTNDASVTEAVAAVVEKEGKIDVLINNAGYGVMGPAETVSMEQAKAEFDVNFFGLLRVTQAVLPHMREQQSGHIINISSIAGIRAMPTSDLYNASKFAVEGLTEAMAPTLAVAGIKMTLIEPGPVDTDFIGRSLQLGEKLQNVEVYRKITEKISARRTEMFKHSQKPEEIAALINEAITSEKPDFRYQTSEAVKEMARAKLVDLTGNEIIEKSIEGLR